MGVVRKPRVRTRFPVDTTTFIAPGRAASVLRYLAACFFFSMLDVRGFCDCPCAEWMGERRGGNPVSLFSESSIDWCVGGTHTSFVHTDSKDSSIREPRSLQEAQDRFIAVWGQMGSVWGISRTMAEVHALLYITDEPMCTDDVMERLQISRGNASMSLRALVDWGIVERSHKRGDRKEYFRAEQDAWAMARAIVRERLKREVDPLVGSLYEIRDMTRKPAKTPRKGGGAGADQIDEHHRRVDELIELFLTLQRVSQAFVGPAGRGVQAAVSLLNSPIIASLRSKGRDTADASGQDGQRTS